MGKNNKQEATHMFKENPKTKMQALLMLAIFSTAILVGMVTVEKASAAPVPHGKILYISEKPLSNHQVKLQIRYMVSSKIPVTCSLVKIPEGGYLYMAKVSKTWTTVTRYVEPGQQLRFRIDKVTHREFHIPGKIRKEDIGKEKVIYGCREA
jgi:hypothetical protein